MSCFFSVQPKYIWYLHSTSPVLQESERQDRICYYYLGLLLDFYLCKVLDFYGFFQVVMFSILCPLEDLFCMMKTSSFSFLYLYITLNYSFAQKLIYSSTGKHYTVLQLFPACSGGSTCYTAWGLSSCHPLVWLLLSCSLSSISLTTGVYCINIDYSVSQRK